MIELIASNTEAEKERMRQANAVGWKMRELAANILRVAAGAGKPDDLPHQITVLAEAVGKCDYETAVHATKEPLRDRDWRRHSNAYAQPTEQDRARYDSSPSAALDHAKEAACEAALRLTAAELLAQALQESMAGKALGRAMNAYAEARKALCRANGIMSVSQTEADAAAWRKRRRERNQARWQNQT